MARPQWGASLEKVEERSLEIIIALDTSKSMLASDFKPTRLQQAKWGIQDLIRTLPIGPTGVNRFFWKCLSPMSTHIGLCSF